MADMTLSEIYRGACSVRDDFKSLSERMDYLHVAVMRGDPRYAKAEYARHDFDGEAFDREWKAKGKRVPSANEILG